MSNDIGRMQTELECLGYAAVIRDSAQGKVVEFEYWVETGSHPGETVPDRHQHAGSWLPGVSASLDPCQSTHE